MSPLFRVQVVLTVALQSRKRVSTDIDTQGKMPILFDRLGTQTYITMYLFGPIKICRYADVPIAEPWIKFYHISRLKY